MTVKLFRKARHKTAILLELKIDSFRKNGGRTRVGSTDFIPRSFIFPEF